MSLDYSHGAWKSDEEIVGELLEIRARHAKWGVLQVLTRPLARRELRQWSVTNALRIPATLPVVKLYWGPPWGVYPPEETLSPVPLWSIAMLHVLAVAYADPVIAGDLQFRNLLKYLDPRGHQFCRIGEVMDYLATPENPLAWVLGACNQVFGYVRDVPFTDGNMNNLATLVIAIVLLTGAKHELRVVNQRMAWVTLARKATAAAQQTAKDFHMPEITGKIQSAAAEIERLTEVQARRETGYKEVRSMADGDELVGLSVHEFRETIRWLGIREELRQWIVC